MPTCRYCKNQSKNVVFCECYASIVPKKKLVYIWKPMWGYYTLWEIIGCFMHHVCKYYTLWEIVEDFGHPICKCCILNGTPQFMLCSTISMYCWRNYNFNLEFCDHYMGNVQMKGGVFLKIWVHMPNGLCFVELKVWYTSAKKYIHYQISCNAYKICKESCPSIMSKMFKIEKNKRCYMWSSLP